MYRVEKPHGLMFHRFHAYGTRPKSQGSLSEKEFDQIIKGVNVERIITPEEWLYKVKSNTLQASDLCVTFDDGLRSQIRFALPILDKYGIKAFWFIFSSVFSGDVDLNEINNIFITSYFESFDKFYFEFESKSKISKDIFDSNKFTKYHRSLMMMFPFYSENDVKYRYVRNYVMDSSTFSSVMKNMMQNAGTSILEIANNVWLNNEDLTFLNNTGHCIGLHSYNHPFVLADLSVKDQQSEYVKNFEHISSQIQGKIECMSHPLNSYSEDTISILQDLGIICGFRSNMKKLTKMETKYIFNLQIPREDSSILRSSLT